MRRRHTGSIVRHVVDLRKNELRAGVIVDGPCTAFCHPALLCSRIGQLELVPAMIPVSFAPGREGHVGTPSIALFDVHCEMPSPSNSMVDKVRPRLPMCANGGEDQALAI